MDPIIARLERLERDYRRSRLWNRIALLALLVVVCAGFAQQQDPKLPDVIRCKQIEAEIIRCSGLVGTPLGKPGDVRFSLGTMEGGSSLLVASPDSKKRFLVAVTDRAAEFFLTDDTQRIESSAEIHGRVGQEPARSDLILSHGGRKRASLAATETASSVWLSARSELLQFSAYTDDDDAWFDVAEWSKSAHGSSANEMTASLVRKVAGLIGKKNDKAHLRIDRDRQARAVLGTMEGTDKLGRETHYPESTLTLLGEDRKVLVQLPR